MKKITIAFLSVLLCTFLIACGGVSNTERDTQELDTSKLEKTIATMEKINTEPYTEKSVESFLKALERGKEVLDMKLANQDDVDKALDNLNLAFDRLESKDDVTSSDEEGNNNTEKPTNENTKSEWQSVLSNAFGDFEEVVIDGNGDDVVTIPDGASCSIMDIEYSGSRNFSIWLLDSKNDNLDLLVNTIGDYKGTVTSLQNASKEPASLQISASGPWSVKFYPIASAPVLKSGESYSGDKVVIYEGTSINNIEITNAGKSNFNIWAMNEDGRFDLLVNEIGDYSGKVPLKFTSGVFIVSSEGEWSIIW